MKNLPKILFFSFVAALTWLAPGRCADKPNSDFVLGADDVVEITVRNHSDLNRTATIRPDGKITMTRAGDVQAAGRTAQQLADVLNAALNKTLNHAEVTVSVKEVHSRRARIIGAVKNAGTFELKPNWRLLDLIAVAGGLSAKPSRVVGRLVRLEKSHFLYVDVAVLQPDTWANIKIRPNDLVVLDEILVAKQISVIGQVKVPGAYDLSEGLTPVSLVAQTGGATDSAALSRAYVLRGTKQLPLNLQSVLNKGKTDPQVTNFRFAPGDVLVVPENQLRFAVMGQVAKPGYYALPEDPGDATALRAIGMAGGTLPNADLPRAEITRTTGGKNSVIPVNIAALMTGEARDTTILAEGDVLYVPTARNQVHVIGKVKSPGAYEIKEGMTLMALVAEAGSAAEGAGLSKAYILRGNTQIPVNLRAALINGIVDDNIKNFRLAGGDVLVIPDVSNQLNVQGEVLKPGSYDLGDNISFATLVGQAGGLTTSAALSKAYVMRAGVQKPVFATPPGANPDLNAVSFQFEPGDVLVIPENRARFLVTGSVMRSGYFPLPEDSGQVTVLEALSAANGQSPDGDLKRAIIARTVNGKDTPIPVNIDAMLRRGGPGSELRLQAGDVLYIPQKGQPSSPLSFLGPLSLLFR